MVKILFVCFFAFTGIISYSQGPAAKEKIIYLEEVLISNTESRKVKKIKNKGSGKVYFSASMESTFVTMVEDIPEGYLGSVKFFFNGRKQGDYADRIFKLEIFKKGPDNFPGEKIIKEDLNFEVPKDHKGEIALDLSKLHIRTSETLYFGLKLLASQGNNSGFSIACNENKRSKVYFRGKDTAEWFIVPGINFKLELKVETTR